MAYGIFVSPRISCTVTTVGIDPAPGNCKSSGIETGFDVSDLLTSADLAEFGDDIRADIADLHMNVKAGAAGLQAGLASLSEQVEASTVRLERSIDAMRTRLVRVMILSSAATVTLTVTFVKLLS